MSSPSQTSSYSSLHSSTQSVTQRRYCRRRGHLPMHSKVITVLIVLANCWVLVARAVSLVVPLLNANGVEQELDAPLDSEKQPVLVSTHPDQILESSTNQPVTSTTDAFFHLLNIPKKPSPPAAKYLFDGAPGIPNSIWSNSVSVLVTEQSWMVYNKFKQDTCRDSVEPNIADRPLNSTESGILPETKDGSYRSVIGSTLLKSLDPKIFASPQQSLCKPKPIDYEMEAMNALSSHSFEDYLIDNLLSRRGIFFILTIEKNCVRRVIFSLFPVGDPSNATTPTSVTLSPILVEEPKADEELMLSVA
uniref:Uncharacterized protein n=1 Tax=Ditylenchus dipsaci TaxID=166011 RepID=A0A915ERV5_9BILA